MSKIKDKLTVTLVIAHLGLGGAERMLALLANHWASKGWHVTFITLDHGGGPHFYPLDPSIIYIDFGWSQVWKSAIPKLRLLYTLMVLRRALKCTKPDVILSFLNTTNVSVLMATYKMGVPVIVSERNDPSYDMINNKWERLRRWFYPTASCVVAQTQTAFNYFSPRVRKRGRIIPNPVLLPPNGGMTIGMPDKSVATKKTIIAVGRLAEQKGFDLLLEAFAKIAPSHVDWSLTIWGEGDDRSHLEAMACELGLHDRVHLPGKTQQIYERLRQADIFVLSSRYEGFPNALCEAMACGLPVISFDCPSGPNEIIRNGIDGLLVPPGDVKQLAATLQQLINDTELRSRLSGKAPQILERFSFEKVIGMWEKIILNSVVERL